MPLIALVHRLNRLLQQDMVVVAARRGYPELKNSHNAVFATLDPEGGRPSAMAAQAGITRQSMGEVIRDMVRLGLVEMGPDPTDQRAKLVTWTAKGLELAQEGVDHIREVEAHLASAMGDRAYARLRDSLEQARLVMADYTERTATESAGG